MATELQIAACKAYMRVDGDEDNGLIGQLCDAAAEYLSAAGAERGEDGSARAARYDLALWALTLHYYDHRDAVGTEAALPLGIRPIITQLKLTRPTQS